VKHQIVILLLLGIVLTGGCYYDNEEYLYPVVQNPSACDTAVVSFATRLTPVIQQNCISCHSGAAASGGIVLESHADVAANIDAVIGAINHAPGFTPMPQGGNKLPACTILQFEVWRSRGSQNN